MKDRNTEDLTEAKNIKRWQEYAKELYQKGFNDLKKPPWCGHSPRARHAGM